VGNDGQSVNGQHGNPASHTAGNSGNGASQPQPPANRAALQADLALATRLSEINHLRDLAVANADIQMLQRADELERQARWLHSVQIQQALAAQSGAAAGAPGAASNAAAQGQAMNTFNPAAQPSQPIGQATAAGTLGANQQSTVPAPWGNRDPEGHPFDNNVNVNSAYGATAVANRPGPNPGLRNASYNQPSEQQSARQPQSTQQPQRSQGSQSQQPQPQPPPAQPSQATEPPPSGAAISTAASASGSAAAGTNNTTSGGR
jgi:hypothetical protein